MDSNKEQIHVKIQIFAKYLKQIFRKYKEIN